MGLLAALAAPASAGAVSTCAAGPGTVLEHRALLAGDGTPEASSTWVVEAGGASCRSPRATAPVDLGVAVAIVHRDADGATVEPAQLSRVDGTVTTRVRITDATAVERALTATGSAGPVRGTRRIGAPMTVRVELSYPGSWAPRPVGDAAVRAAGRRTLVTSTVVLAVPFTPDAGELEVVAEPGRGVPEVTVVVTTLPGEVLAVLRDRSEDAETYAVLGALLEVTADGTVELADGAGELADGLDELADGTEELADGTRELADGVAELADGVDALVDGVEQLADGTRQLAEGTTAYTEGIAVLGGQLAALAALSEVVANGLGAGFPAVCASLPGTPSSLPESAATVACGLAGVREAFDDPERGLVIGGAELAGGATLTADGVDELLAGVRELAEGTRALAEGTEDLAAGTRELADGAREAADGARELADGADEVPEALVELLGIADRRAAALALDDAAVARATALATERARGADGAVAVLTTAAGDAEVPVVALGAAGGASLALLPVLALAWRRRRRGSA